MINKKEVDVPVLGQDYKFRLIKEEDLEDRIKSLFVDYRGTCNTFDKEIIVQDMTGTLQKAGNLLTTASSEDAQVRCEQIIMNETARHELMHAFFKESGLADEFESNNEVVVDWFAIQLPKIVRACCEVHAFTDDEMESFIKKYNIHDEEEKPKKDKKKH